MKKIITLLFASLLLATSAQAAGMVGVKLGIGELDAENNSYTAGSTTVASQSGDKKMNSVLYLLNLKYLQLMVYH